MHPVSGYSHFSKWLAKRQQDCIRACGLAHRLYRNKTARIGVISKLLNHELPLDTAEVKREMARRTIPITTHHATKLSLKLLDSMSGTVRPAATNAVSIETLSADKLAKTAREQVEKCMFLSTDSGVSEAVLQLWKDRCKVGLVCNNVLWFPP